MTQVATFKDINRITTLFLPKEDAHSNHEKSLLKSLPPSIDDNLGQGKPCRCREMKTQVKITTTSKDEDLVITCNGYNVSNNIYLDTHTTKNIYWSFFIYRLPQVLQISLRVIAF